MSRQLSAKDKAFLAEKQKLQKTISSLEVTLATQKAANRKDNRRVDGKNQAVANYNCGIRGS